MFLKCSKAVQNKTAVQHFLSHSTRLSKRGEITVREATSSSACHWCLHHEARHPSPSKPHEKEQPPPCASAAPREPRREQEAVPPTPRGRQGWRKGNSPSAWQQTAPGRVQRFGWEEAKRRDLVGDKKRRKGQLCPKRFPAPGFERVSQDSSQESCCWPTLLCRHLPPPPLLLATSVPFPIAPHSIHFPVPPTQLVPPPFPLPALLALWLQILFLHLCLPYFTHHLAPHSPLLSLSSSIHRLFSLFWASCIQPFLLLNNQEEWRTEENRTRWAYHKTGEVGNGEEAVRLERTWVKRTLWGVVKTREDTTRCTAALVLHPL